MARSGVMNTHYCHACHQRISPTFQNACPTCPNCHEGFIEEVESHNVMDMSPTTQDILSWLPIWTQLGSGPSNVGDSPTSSNIDDVASPVSSHTRSRMSDFLSQNSDSQIPALLNSSLMRIMMLMGSDFQSTLLGAPPASSESINQLEKLELTQENIKQCENCSVCFETYKISDSVLRLPCQHIFHDSCIKTWLKQHGTCPICRKDLMGRDTSQENTENGPGGSGEFPFAFSYIFE